MEYLHGEDLRVFLRKHRKTNTHVPLQHVITIGVGMAAALHHAHEQCGA